MFNPAPVRLARPVTSTTPLAGPLNAHTDLQRRMIFKRATNLYGAADRRFRTGVKNQRHAVATGDFDQAIGRVGFLKLLSGANNLREFIHGRLLLVNGKFRIPNDVDKQNMRYLQGDLFCRAASQ